MAKKETYSTGGDNGVEDSEQQAQASQFEVWKAQARDHYKELDLKNMVIAMADGRTRKEELERDLSRCNAFYDILRYEMVPGRMDEAGIDTIAYDGIGRVSLTPDLFVSTKPGQQQGLFSWLTKHKLKDLIKPAVNSSTLKAWVKKRMKEGKAYPSELLNITPVTRASITKVKG